MSYRALSKLATLALALGAVAAGATASLAQAWPSRTITMIVPYAAGGGADPVARLIADGMAKRLGVAVVPDFRPGANGTIGTAPVAKAAGDGYTLLFTPPTPVVAMKLMMPDLSYDPDKDLVPIIVMTNSPAAIMASNKFAPKDFKEFVEYGLKNPGKISVAVPGLGGAGHQALVLMDQLLGLKINLVPYKGTGALLPDILSGDLDASSDFPAAYIPQVGKVRVLAMLSKDRLPALPNVPTSGEMGFPQVVTGGWYGLYAAKGTSPDIVKKINGVVNEILQEKDVRAKIEGLGYQILGGTPEDFVKAIEYDKKTIGKMVSDGLLKLE